MGHWRPTSEDLALLGAVIRSGGVNAAARELGRPKQTVSRQIARLEGAAGTALFERARGAMRPTPLALVLLPYSEIVLAAESNAAIALAKYNGMPSGTLTVRAQAVFAQSIVAPSIARLLSKYQALNVELRVENARREPIDPDVDVAITLGKPRDPELKIRLIARLPVGLYAPAAERPPEAMEKAKIERLPRIVYGRDLQQPWLLEKGTEQWVLDQPAIALVDEPEAALQMLVNLEEACGLLPRFMAEPMVQAGSLRRLAPDWSGRDVRIYFAVSPGRSQIPAVVALAKEITAYAPTNQGWSI
ncbi:LysR family transcriptional regulator [Qipengyuania qiaonensis]|uniref:LysR family transcriptional regulator n=1 Tax=Qipengyuania qiaonensis TaxID=2867240 RepID=A0ABS7J2R0_9SPHN|nr:LysR family transcriptional regulator [Qipengyuania qiaonensis]MBX7481610.1 LysR family transcriptional regulator [Qipengyuania qiaonensis]